MKRRIQMALSLIILSGCLAGCSLPTNLFKSEEIEIVPTPTPLAYRQLGVLEVEGSVYDSPDSYYGKNNRPFVLYDLSGFMKASETSKMDPNDMIIAHLNSENGKMKYTLHLPITPMSVQHDVYENNAKDNGVQIFTYWWAKDFEDSDYIEQDEQLAGWPIYDMAITFDETGSQIVSGWLLIWAEDNQQMFPVQVGEDGILFTDDDVMEPVLPGYTSVYLEDGMLTWDRSEKVKVSILAPYDIRQFDFSHKDSMDAFEQTIKLLEENYQNWDDEVSADELTYINNGLREELKSAVKDNNQDAINAVFGKLVSTMDNGMVSISSNANLDMIKAAYPADFGFAAQTFSDGTVRVTDMRINSPTFSTNLDYGYIILQVDDMPVDEAIAATPISFFPNGNEETTRRLQEIFLFRKPEDEKIKIKVLDPKGEEETLTLTSTADTELLEQVLPDLFSEFQSYQAPVVAENVENFGVIHVYDMDQDPSLTIEMFERSLLAFWKEGITDYIIDLRNTKGDTYLNLAGFFTSAQLKLGTYTCGDEHIWPMRLQSKERTFIPDSISVLIGSGCRGACELEALVLSQLSATTIYGHEPTYGSFDIGFQSSIKLPNNLQIDFPHCSMEEIAIPKNQETVNVVPDVYFEKPLYEGFVGSSYMIDQVVALRLKKDYEAYTTGPMETLTINELIWKYDDALYINGMVKEDEQQMLYFHDQPSYDLHVPVYLESDDTGVFDYTICMDSYNELMLVVNAVTPVFTIDTVEVESSKIYMSSYLSDQQQNCYFWLFGTRSFPAGFHEITMKLTIAEPVTFHDSLWEPGDYEYHYQFYFYPDKED